MPTKDGVRAVILCPTRELAMQTTRELKKLIVGTKFRVRVMTKAVASCNDFSNLPCDILVSTPLRLDFLLRESKIDLSRYGLKSVKLIANEGLGWLKDVSTVFLLACMRK